MRFGIIGCGTIGPTHAAAIQQIAGLELVAAADLSLERAKYMANKFGVERFYRGHEELLADETIEAVTVCTPSGIHAEVGVAALLAGKHVLVEKPMDIRVESCDRLLEAARKSGKTLGVISQHRFDKATQLAKHAIEEGRLGRLAFVEGSVKWWRTQDYYDSGDWRGTLALDGGGALMNQGVHTVDLLLHLAGPVESVSAQTRTAAHERLEVEDIAVAVLTFKSGAVGVLSASTAAYPGYPVRIELFGTEGTLIMEGDRLKEMHFKNGEEYIGEEAASDALSVARGGTASLREEARDRNASANSGAVWGDAHRMQIEEFVNAVQENREPAVNGHTGRAAVALVSAVYESAKIGRAIPL